MFGFHIDIRDIVDILLAAILMYECFRLLRKSGAVNLFWGIIAFVGAWILVCYVFQLPLTGALFDRIISVGAIAVIVIFQDEIRTFFYGLGSRFLSVQNKLHTTKQDQDRQIAMQIVRACMNMARSKTGALLVIRGKQELNEYIDSGETIDAAISSRLIENIFFKNTPLHDGALILDRERLIAASCILPVSRDMEIPKRYGLRHRSALGIAEKSDATAIVVSEETGHISVARNSTIQEVTEEQLLTIIGEAFE